MIKFAEPQAQEPQKDPKLILSPSDLDKICRSDRETTEFASEQYAEVAALLEKLAMLERTAETKLRAWQHDPESYLPLFKEVEAGQHEARKRLHDILLDNHSYPNGPQLLLMPSDAYKHDDTFHQLEFRNSDMQNLAHNIAMVARFEQELETYLTRQGDYEESERQAMIKDTLVHLHRTKDHLTKILTGYYDKPKHP